MAVDIERSESHSESPEEANAGNTDGEANEKAEDKGYVSDSDKLDAAIERIDKIYGGSRSHKRYTTGPLSREQREKLSMSATESRKKK